MFFYSLSSAFRIIDTDEKENHKGNYGQVIVGGILSQKEGLANKDDQDDGNHQHGNFA
jgi:hypothetical protein